jgi:hypothetical protein
MVRHAVPEDDYLAMKHLQAWTMVEIYISHAHMLYERSLDGIPGSAINALLGFLVRSAGKSPRKLVAFWFGRQ